MLIRKGLFYLIYQISKENNIFYENCLIKAVFALFYAIPLPNSTILNKSNPLIFSLCYFHLSQLLIKNPLSLWVFELWKVTKYYKSVSTINKNNLLIILYKCCENFSLSSDVYAGPFVLYDFVLFKIYAIYIITFEFMRPLSNLWGNLNNIQKKYASFFVHSKSVNIFFSFKETRIYP